MYSAIWLLACLLFSIYDRSFVGVALSCLCLGLYAGYAWSQRFRRIKWAVKVHARRLREQIHARTA